MEGRKGPNYVKSRGFGKVQGWGPTFTRMGQRLIKGTNVDHLLDKSI
jgi:hypothetical protein